MVTVTHQPATARGADGAARRAEILRRLQTAGFLSVTHLTQQLGVSDMTVRRDLKRLAETGEVRVVHGGVSLPHGALRPVDFSRRGGRETEAKRRIAQEAVKLIEPGATVAIDAGTTPFELAAALPEGFQGTVITHSVPVLQHMLHMPGVRVIGLGGELLGDSQALVGALTVEALAGVHAEILFLGAAAVNRRGLFIAADLERHTKRTLMTIADRVVLLADHSKFSAAAPVRLAPLPEVDVLVTDAPPNSSLARALDDAGVRIISCPVPPQTAGTSPAAMAAGGSTGP